MKTTIDIPESALADAMRFPGAKTKREAVVKALEEFNRLRKVEALFAAAGTFSGFPSNDEIEAADLEQVNPEQSRDDLSRGLGGTVERNARQAG